MSTEEPGGQEPTQQPGTSEPAPPSEPAAPSEPAIPAPPPVAPPMAPPPVTGQPEGAQTGWGAATAPAEDMMAPPPKSKTGMIVAIVAVAVLVVGAGAFLLTKSGSSTETVTLPATLIGLPQLNDAASQQLTSQFESNDFSGMKFKAALYGTGAPQLIVLATDAADTTDLKAEFSSFLTGFTSTSQATIDTAGRLDETRGDVDIACVPATISGVSTTVCAWSEANVFGAIVDLRSGDASAGIDTTEKVAHDVTS